ncbi:MAG TPA: RNA polymerase sigma factor RpoE, partial [Oceanospirillales bacterium]|nr:RNA polymerase sigma factor RpoE [Oceanospirillales bacterium]
AVNTAKNYLVSRGRKTPTSDIDPDDAENFSDAAMFRDNATPERILQRDRLKEVVFSAMAELPEELRIAVSLRELDGMSYDEIADVMDCPIGTVRSRIFRARESIEQKMQPYLEASA